MAFQTFENDENNRGKIKRKNLKNEIRSAWLGIRDSNQIYRGSFNKNKKCTIMCIFYLC